MADYNVKNYTEQGGEKTVIGGTIEVPGAASFSGTADFTGAEVSGLNQVPASGTTGQFLKKTSEGAVFDDLPDAAASVKGVVKQAANVAAVTPAGDAPTALETAVNGILEALKAAGIMAADAEG